MRFSSKLHDRLTQLQAASPITRSAAKVPDLLPEEGDWGNEIRNVVGKVKTELKQIIRCARTNPGFLFHASVSYPTSIRALRIDALRHLKDWYRSHSLTDRVDAERYVRREVGFPVFSNAVQRLQKLLRTHPDVRVVRGAENVSFILAEKRVLKVTQSRHEKDFYSIINLAKNMNVLYEYLDRKDSRLQVEVKGRDMFFGDFPSGMNRLVIQPYVQAPGIGDLKKTQRQSPRFVEAWNAFADCLEAMQREQGVVLDLTNSEAGMRPSRGNVWDTKNVMVDLETDPPVFSIIDPDVFDISDVKFSPCEQLRPDRRSEQGLFSSASRSAKMCIINQARQCFVLPWQENRFASFTTFLREIDNS